MGNLKRVSLYIMYVTDLAALLLAFFVAYPIRKLLPIQEGFRIPDLSVYTPLLYGTIIAYVIVAFTLLYNDKFYNRSVLHEILSSARMVAIVMALNVLIFYFTKTGEQYSRLYVGVYIVTAFLLDVFFRLLVKKGILPLHKKGRTSERLVVATEEDRVDEILTRLNTEKDWRFQVTGLILVDVNRKGEWINGLPVISNRAEALTDIFNREVDSILLALPEDVPEREWVDTLQRLGKTVYINLNEFYYSESRRMLDYVGDCAVVSYQPAMPIRGRSLVAKRFFDALLAILLLPFVLLVTVVAGLLIKILQGGPVFIGRERIGRNGHRFRMYHFRTLRNNVAERISKNESPFSPIGSFLRKTHLDGLPMVFNVLVGDMSFVGPQAVTEEQVRGGNSQIIRNLCTRPGIVGVWSSQRAEGKTADLNEYLNTWSLRRGLRLAAKSVLQYLTFHSGRVYTDEWRDEEERILTKRTLERQPLSYDRSFYPNNGIKKTGYLFIKRFVDIMGSLVGIVLLSWLLLLLIILIIVDDGGNPIYGHARIGKDGKRIRVLKFRSMRQSEDDLRGLFTAEQLEQYRTEFKIDNDPRITKIGNFLRKASLDELPQLFNILTGDLSIVGPRPIVEEETAIYGRDIAKLLSVMPGLTGYWQAYARNNATYETGERQRMEMYYVDHQSPLLDLRIMFRTVFSVFRQDGAQ